MPTASGMNSFVLIKFKTKTNYMNDKTKNILRWLPSFVIATQLTVSAVLKFTSFPFLVQSFTEIGLVQYLKIFGSMEILLEALFLYPRTMRIGFLLLTAYFGGAMAVEITHGTFVAPVVILTLIWIAAYLRKPEIFKGNKNNIKHSFSSEKIFATQNKI